MLATLLPKLAKQRIVLASQSPRRLDLLSRLDLKFDVVPSTFEEDLDKAEFATPDLYVIENARLKALEVFDRLKEQTNIPDLIIGCDTVVVQDGEILEKPKDKIHAVKMLLSLSGRTHSVYSGVVLMSVYKERDVISYKTDQFYERTEVQFTKIDNATAEAYVETGEPMDKAGGYGLQGIGGSFVKGINGCCFNVIGFPINHFCEKLKEIVE